MKKILTAAACVLMLLASCKKDDKTPPKFTMSGAPSITHSLNAPFVDPGVTALDNEDGNVTVTSDVSLTNPNVDLTGHYIITYKATDAAGNSDQITRDVLVVNDAAFMAAGYDVTYSCGLNYTDGIITSTEHNDRIIFNEIGRYPNANAKLEATIDFSAPSPYAVNIVPATIHCGTYPNVVDRSFSGSGYLNQDTLHLTIDEQVLPSGPVNTCTYIYVRQ